MLFDDGSDSSTPGTSLFVMVGLGNTSAIRVGSPAVPRLSPAERLTTGDDSLL